MIGISTVAVGWVTVKTATSTSRLKSKKLMIIDSDDLYEVNYCLANMNYLRPLLA
jgi:hypothetical protein